MFEQKSAAHFCLAAVLASLASTGFAKSNWVRLGEDERADVYVDTVKVDRPPAYVKLWTMLNFKHRQRGGWMSEKRLFMFSCKDRSLEWQQSIYYADSMGEGEFIHARSLSRYGVNDLRLAELDPSTKDKRKYREAVPESAFNSTFSSLC